MSPFVVVAVIASATILLGAGAASPPSVEDEYQIRVSSADPFDARVKFRVIGARGSIGPRDLEGSLGDTITVFVPTTLTVRRDAGRVRVEAFAGAPWLRVEVLPDRDSGVGAGPFITRELEVRGDSIWMSNHYLPGDPAPPTAEVP